MKLIEQIEKELSKPPKIKITSISNTKSEKEKAKMVEKLIRYQFEHNTNGCLDKYLKLVERLNKEYINELIYGIKVKWKSIEESIKSSTK